MKITHLIDKNKVFYYPKVGGRKMKKYIGVCLIVITTSIFTGCGSKNKTLICSKKDTSTGMEINESINVDFEEEHIAKAKIVQIIAVDDSYISYMENLKNSFERQFANYQDKKGISMNTEIKNHNIEISIVANFGEMDDEAKESLDIINTKATYSDMKKTFENQSYICK